MPQTLYSVWLNVFIFWNQYVNENEQHKFCERCVFGYYKTCRIISTPPKFVKCQPPPWNIVTLLMNGWGNTRTSEGKKVGESWESKIALESKWIKWWRSLDAWGELKKANGFIEEKRGWKWEGKGGDGGEREGVGGFSTGLAQGATAPWN